MSQLSTKAKNSEQKKQAIEWLVLLRSDNVSENDLYAFAHWLAEEHAHSVNFAEAEKLYDAMSYAANTPVISEYNNVCAEMEKNQLPLILSSHLIHENIPDKHNKRQRWLISAIAIAAVWLFATCLYFPQQFLLLDKLNSDYYTQTGEIRDISLADGSHILLNTNSAVSLAYDDSIRKVILLHGQARFTVAKDPFRPFEVSIDDLTIKALGTVFQVNRVSNDIKVTVQEHVVAVSRATSNDTVKITTGQQLNIIFQQALQQPREVKLNQVTAWQQRHLIINDQPLGELIKELQRYRHGRIFLADKQLQDLRITGVFSLEDPEAILNSVINVLHLKATWLGPWWVVLRR